MKPSKTQTKSQSDSVKIRITRACVQPGRPFEVGQIVELPAEDAARLVAIGNAQEIAAGEPMAQ